MTRLHTIQIRKWTDFADLVRPGGDFAGWAYRGHANETWPLWSTLSRRLRDYGVKKQMWPQQEARVIRIFKRKAHLYLDHVPGDDEDFHWLSIMQHFGAPTRLLDFSWSAHVAAYFALESSTSNAAVWAVHPGRIWEQNETVLRSKIEKDMSLRKSGVFQETFLRSTERFVYQGEPGVMNRRLTAQCGTFLVPSKIDEPIENILRDYKNHRDLVVKFVFRSRRVRDESMANLYACNVRSTSLFPDLLGLAGSLSYELEHHWAYNTKTGARHPGFEHDHYITNVSTKIEE